eukprot:4654170-Ditylum_brightwellii.AAC.1
MESLAGTFFYCGASTTDVEPSIPANVPPPHVSSRESEFADPDMAGGGFIPKKAGAPSDSFEFEDVMQSPTKQLHHELINDIPIITAWISCSRG